MAIVPETSTMDRHRERMLEGLAASIREQGLARTQVTDIVRHARASRTTFYKCFADKESCFIELVRVTTTVGLEAVENAVDPAAPWERQVADGVRAYFDALTAEPAIAVAVTAQPAPRVGSIDGLGSRATDKLIIAACPYAWPWNVIGWPAVNIPAGVAGDRLPVGATLLGPAGAEPLLISLVAQLEKARAWHRQRPPTFPASELSPSD